MADELISLDEALRISPLSEHELCTAISDGRIQVFRDSDRELVRREDAAELARWLEDTWFGRR